jgi:hypothetical protein
MFRKRYLAYYAACSTPTGLGVSLVPMSIGVIARRRESCPVFCEFCGNHPGKRMASLRIYTRYAAISAYMKYFPRRLRLHTIAAT